MDYAHIDYGVSQGVATLVLNRPEALNAFSDQMMTDLALALKDAEADDNVRCVIITGIGRAFSAGADIKGWNRTLEQAERQPGNASIPGLERAPIGDFILGMTKPVIAAVNGLALGVGATIPLTCDIRIASENARFAFSFVTRALVAEIGSTFFLPRLVGYGMAKELFLTGRNVEAQEAKEIGLVNAVYPAADLMPRTLELAQSIVANP
ncbi:MAG: enoyl-CoA hydratase-related protein, partial [Dehalococcoidia bacterium]|nr:enoyl-CoA hydratase-related protein [Dehalococcoidia bacterium]